MDPNHQSMKKFEEALQLSRARLGPKNPQSLVLMNQLAQAYMAVGKKDLALPLVEEALRGGPGPYALQAAIAALHCQAARAEETDWPQIVRLGSLRDLRPEEPEQMADLAVVTPAAK